jgi:hypothetical protein
MPNHVPLTQHIDTLYPVARVLVGEDDASRLMTETFRRAAQTANEERPDDRDAWLVDIMLEVRAGKIADSPATDAPAVSEDSAASTPLDETRGFRREVARSVAVRALPVALAACSEQERALLTLHASGPDSPDVLHPIARTIADDLETAIDEAYGELRAALRDVLSGPERMLIDTALPDASMEEVLAAYVNNTYHPAPARLRSDVAATVERERARRRGEDAEPVQTPTPEEDRLSVHLRRTGLALLILTVIGGAAYAAAVWLTPAPSATEPPAPASLVDFSADRVAGVEPLVRTSDADSVVAVLQNRFDRRVEVPLIDRSRILGVGALSVDTMFVPTILYADSTREATLTTYVYSYALIDRIGKIATLDDDLARGLDTADSVLIRRSGDARLALWRHSDDVFVTVSPDPDVSLNGRIRPMP